MPSIAALPTLLRFRPNASSPSTSYTLPSSLFTSAVQLTLSLCSAPLAYNHSDVTIFSAATNDSYTYFPPTLLGGFGNITIPALEDSSNLVIQIGAVTDDPQDYSFEVGVSVANNPWYILDTLPLFAFEDADNTTALLTSPTYPSALVDQPSYSPLVVPTNMVRDDLSNSSCYIRSLAGSDTISGISVNLTTTSRGVVELDISEGGRVNETAQEGKKLQYALANLQPGSNYSVWGVQPDGVTDGTAEGDRLFLRQYFATQKDNNCRLLYDVPFCPDIAYSVPAPPQLDTPSLLSLYNDSIAPHLSGFNLTLSTFPCSDPVRKDQGMYSFVRTCSQCLQAYTSWLCAIRMPRCVDYDPNPPVAITNGSSSDSDSEIDSFSIPTFPRTSPNDSRTPSLPEEAFPYSELPPCIDVCHIVQASCPPLISNIFNCPYADITMESSYSTPFTFQEPDKEHSQLVFGNAIFQGGDDPAWSAQSYKSDGKLSRAKDRWGNVRCNDLGVIALTQRRRWSGSIVGSDADPARRLDFRIAVAVAVIVSSFCVVL